MLFATMPLLINSAASMDIRWPSIDCRRPNDDTKLGFDCICRFVEREYASGKANNSKSLNRDVSASRRLQNGSASRDHNGQLTALFNVEGVASPIRIYLDAKKDQTSTELIPLSAKTWRSCA